MSDKISDLETVIESIKEVLIGRFSVRSDALEDDVMINWDIGIEGDDAVDLIKEIEGALGVNVKIPIDEYFSGEGLFARKRKPLTITQLAELILESKQG